MQLENNGLKNVIATKAIYSNFEDISFAKLSFSNLTNTLNVLINARMQVEGEFQIFSTNGNKIFTKSTPIKIGINRFEFHLQGVQDGIYLCKLALRNKVLTERFLIQH